MKSHYILLSLLGSLLFVGCAEDANYSELPKETASVGKQIFFDTNLSNPGGQSCASCHAPEKGFSDPLSRSQSEGIISGAFGNRNSPSLSYNVFSPNRFYDYIDGTYIGGLFWDGRADDLQNQILGPLMNPVEMNNHNLNQVAEKIKQASYFTQLVNLYGKPQSDEQLMSFVADALAKFETSSEVNSFTSKFDYYSKGLVEFTADEKQGLALFKGKAGCAGCHILDADQRTGKVLFTDFSYDNIGIPKNLTNPFYTQPSSVNPAGANYVDLGIGAIVSDPENNGRFKVPSLRNVAISAPYFHNGAITTMKQAIHFYNTRDLNTGEFGPAEYSATVNKEELGNLKLTDNEENQVELFLQTLTDHYQK